MIKKSLIRKGLVFGIIFLFVGAGVIPSTVSVIEKKTAFTSSISPGYIQGLIDNASSGDTIYIPSGTYYENIVIDKSISLIGENKNTTIIDGSNSGNVVNVTTDWVNISGFTIQNSGGWNYLDYDAGINIKYSDYNSITGNNISNNWKGIRFFRSSGCNITNNIILNNLDDGIDLYDSKFNILKGNTISNNGIGINVGESKFNNIKGNTISNNGEGISLYRNPFIGFIVDVFDFNIILKNNFIDNEQDAYFSNSFFNKWILNYWNRPRILPKVILGGLQGEGWGSPPDPIPLLNIDWRPAKQPYDILRNK
jgi:parallel beta-helix repeat protein